MIELIETPDEIAPSPGSPAVGAADPTRSLARRWLRGARGTSISLAVVLALIGLWELASLGESPVILPSPATVLRTGYDLVESGQLLSDIWISFFRIVLGWLIGCAIGFPLGLATGRLRFVSRLLSPIIHYFRFIPPIALLGLFVIWLGIGESAKVGIIVYATSFIIIVNTAAGAQGVPVEKIKAAQVLGGTQVQVFTRVVVPATLPSTITGMRIAMSAAFMTVVAAELVAANSGIGYLIWTAGEFNRTDIEFVGVVCLGLMGVLADLALRLVLAPIKYRYAIKF